MVAGIESECWPDSRRNGGRFPVGIVAGFGRNTHLDSKNRLLCLEIVSVGSLNASIVHPREVYKSALLSSAAAIVFVHNHPSGDPTPSREDIELTSRLKQASDLLGIRLLDHVVIGSGRHFSFADSGLL